MPEKVAVDILDIQEPPPLPEEQSPPEEKRAQERGTGETRKLLVAGLLTALIFSAGGYVLWDQFAPPGAAPETPAAPAEAPGIREEITAAAAPLRVMEMEGFVVDLQDEKGNSRIVLCGVALDADGQQAPLPDQDAEFRRIVYETLRGRKVESLMTSEGRKSLKKEIRDRLAKRGAAAGIRDVYFTKFVVL